jgi:hypothetical protein
MSADLTKQQQFFYDHAGYIYDPATETREQGRRACAVELAAAEAWASEAGIAYEWQPDDTTNREFTDEGPEYHLWACHMGDRANGVHMGSLSGIDLGPDSHPCRDNYARVVEAELALDAMRTHAEPL